jgi:DNA-binding protein YbaB
MHYQDEAPELFRGDALGGAVRVTVDGDRRVHSVRFDERMIGRLRSDQLGDGVVAAFAEATAATSGRER